MEQCIIFPFLAFALLLQSTRAATQSSQPAYPALTSTPQGVRETTGRKNIDDAASIVLPDGTPLRISVVNGFSSASANVGDVIDFAVAFDVRVDGVVVIPQRTVLAAKVLSVNRPRRGARDGQVKIAFEKFTLPTGEAVTVRPLLQSPSRGKAAAEAAAAAPGKAASVFITAGIPLLALPFLRGEEQVVLAGTIEIVYLNGPLSISRQDATALQAATTASGYAYVYVGEGVTGRRKDLSVPRIFCGKRVVGGSFGILQLELSPGTYWFTTDDEKDRPARIDVLASREYFIGRNRHGLLAKEIRARKGSVYPRSAFVNEDLTKLAPEEYRVLTAEPAVKRND